MKSVKLRIRLGYFLRNAWPLLGGALFAAGSLGAGTAAAQPAAPQKQAATAEYLWKSLSANQQRALQPLEGEWRTIDATRRQKWIEIADRYHTLSPDEQARVQARMSQWAQLSPEDRGKARLLFQQAKEVSPSDRGTRWEAYQALPEDERRQLAERAANARPGSSGRSGAASAPTVGRPAPVNSVDGGQRGAGAPKSNLVPNPAFAAPPVAVGPTVVQAAPGATTSLMSRRAEPPSHQQAGLPKITALPGFVDQTTLQPRRGPQAAATRPATDSAPVPRP